VDDVVTTGNSLLSSIELLMDKSIINDILVFVDREQGAENLMKSYNIRVHKIISINEIFDILYKNNKINEDYYLDLKKEIEKIN
jgi:orotate phosphoribosyltransferase